MDRLNKEDAFKHLQIGQEIKVSLSRTSTFGSSRWSVSRDTSPSNAFHRPHTWPLSVINQLVRSVARRDVEDRTLSELIKSQDALERLGLLWNSLDCLNRDQGIELVRNLHVRSRKSTNIWIRREQHSSGRNQDMHMSCSLV